MEESVDHSKLLFFMHNRAPVKLYRARGPQNLEVWQKKSKLFAYVSSICDQDTTDFSKANLPVDPVLRKLQRLM